MTDAPGIPFIRWSADRKYCVIGPGVEADDFKLDSPVQDLGASTFLALQDGTNRFVTRPIPGTGPAPNDLALYVSALGDDVTGNGTAGSPYLKIERALDDVRATGWNDTAEIRVLSTGGPFAWPADLNVTPGGRGRQRLPLTIRGWNGNPTPGRTVVFSQAVTSASSDPTSSIVDLVGPGPYTAAQVGQRIRFTSGALANYPILPTLSVPVDVAIAAVPDGTTLRLTWAANPPAPGDTFVIESLDTTLSVGALSALRSADTLILENVVLAGTASIVGIFSLGGAPLQLQAAHVVTGASTFVLTGYDNGLITGGDLTGLSLAGLTVTTASFFADARGGGVFLTNLNDGPEGADWAMQYAGFVGAGFLRFDGRLGQSYVDGMNLQALTNTVVNSVGLSAASNVVAQFGCDLLLEFVAAAGTLALSEGARCAFQTLQLGGLFSLDSGASAWGTGLTFAGAAPPSWLTLRGGSSLSHTSDVAPPVATAIAITVDENSELRVFGSLTSSGNGGAGLSASGGSTVAVTSACTFSSNGGNGLEMATGARLICGNSFTANANGGTGVFLDSAEVVVAGQLGCQSNTGHGVNAAFSALSAGALLPLTNGLANLRAFGTTIAVEGDFGADGAGTLPSVLLLAATRLTATVLHVAGTAAEALIVSGGSTASIQGDLTVSGAGSAQAGVVVSGGSGLAVGGTLTSMANLVGAGVLVEDGSVLACGGAGAGGGLLAASSNGGHGLSVTSGATAVVQSCQCLSNGGSGVSASTGGRFEAAAGSAVAECSLNAGDGITLSGRSTAYVTATTSAAGNNGGFGAQVLTGSKMQLAPVAQAGAGAGGDVKVGVNAAATWANIATGNSAFVADYLSGQNPTQLCEVAI